MKTAAAIAVLLMLGGCASTVETRTITVFVPLAERIPGETRTCLDEPGAPDPETATQADVVEWTAKVRDAGADCRGNVHAIDDLARTDG